MFSTVTMRREIKVWHPTCAHGVTDASSPEHENTLRIRQQGGRFLPSLECVGETLVCCHVEGEASLTITSPFACCPRLFSVYSLLENSASHDVPNVHTVEEDSDKWR
jgi:hypothetical protein